MRHSARHKRAHAVCGVILAPILAPRPLQNSVCGRARRFFVDPEVWSSLYLACANLQLRRQIINTPVKVMSNTPNQDTKPEQSAEFYALTACRILMRAESMQQGDRNGMIMGIISLAIDAARDAIKESESQAERARARAAFGARMQDFQVVKIDP